MSTVTVSRRTFATGRSQRDLDWLSWILASGSEGPALSPSGVFGALFGGVGLVVLVLGLLPRLGTADRAVTIVTAVGALVVGVTLAVRHLELSRGQSFTLALVGTSWVGAEGYLLGGGAALALVVVFAPLCFAVLPEVAARFVAGYAAVVPGVILGADGALGSDATTSAVRQWIVVIAVLSGLSLAVAVLARRLDSREHVLSSLAGRLEFGIGIVDRDRRYVAANSVFCTMLGRENDEIVGHDVDAFTCEEDVAHTRAVADALLDGIGTSSAFEERFERPDGAVVHALVSCVALAPGRADRRFVLALAEDVSEQRRVDEQRSLLAEQLMSAQEDERRRIAEEVHDDPLQALIALSIQLQILQGRTADEGVLAAIAGLRNSVALAIEQMRSLLFELHPQALELGGLVESLREYVRRYEEAGGPEVELETVIEQEPSSEEAIILFRITTEALTNARKHADAHHVAVSLMNSQGGIALAVSDDGIGIGEGPERISPGHLGVVSMRERAERAGGSFEITARAGGGTTVRAWVPLDGA